MRDEKFKLYDTAFKIGFGLTVLVFVILNLISYVTTEDKFEKLGFSGSFGAKWGIPLTMANHSGYSGIEPFSLALNILITGVCGFVVGLILRFVWKKFGNKSINSQG